VSIIGYRIFLLIALVIEKYHFFAPLNEYLFSILYWVFVLINCIIFSAICEHFFSLEFQNNNISAQVNML